MRQKLHTRAMPRTKHKPDQRSVHGGKMARGKKAALRDSPTVFLLLAIFIFPFAAIGDIAAIMVVVAGYQHDGGLHIHVFSTLMGGLFTAVVVFSLWTWGQMRWKQRHGRTATTPRQDNPR